VINEANSSEEEDTARLPPGEKKLLEGRIAKRKKKLEVEIDHPLVEETLPPKKIHH
jgi:hypothetical protein